MKLNTPEGWADACRETQAELEGLVRPLTDTQFNWKPNPGSWSVGECVEHLNLTHGKMEPLIRKAIEDADKRKKRGGPPFYSSFFGSYFLRKAGPDGSKLPAPPLYRPAKSSLDKDQVLETFTSMQERYIELITENADLQLDRIYAPSAAIPLVRFSTAVWFEGVPAHQKRHIAQIKRVLASEGFPK